MKLAKHQNLISASGFKNHTPVSFNGNQIELDLELIILSQSVQEWTQAT